MRRAHWAKLENNEGDAVAAIMHYLRMCGGYPWLTHDARHRPAHDGVADIECAMPVGAFYHFEVKRRGGKQSTGQRLHEASLAARGHRYYRVECVEDVERAIRGKA